MKEKIENNIDNRTLRIIDILQQHRIKMEYKQLRFYLDQFCDLEKI